MPYVTEQLQFNLNKRHGEPNNQPTLRQPAPLVLSHYGKDAGNMSQSMEMAVTLARRDIRLRNVTPIHDDLDTIPVKEISKLKPVPKIPVGKQVRKPLRVNPVVTPVTKQLKSTNIVSMPVKEPVPKFDESNTQTERQSVIVMIEALSNIKDRLARPNNKKLFPDPIEEARYERRAEAQRRNLYRVLYNAKRHTVQLVTFLERTAFIHRVTVLKQSSIMCHMLNAHRSLMSALGIFLKGAQMLNSAFMKGLKKDVVREVDVLLEEFDKVANLLDIQTQTFTTEPDEGSDQENSVPQLKILDIRKSNPPLSPERDESLRAAVRSLVKTSIMQKRNSTPPPPVSDEETEQPQQRTTHILNDMLHKTSAKKPAMKPKTKLKPKSVTKKKRPTTAAPNKIRSLGNIKKSDVERPCSAPLIGNGQYVSPYSADHDIPLMIRGGQLTPYITERELARQAWLDKLTEDQPFDDYKSSDSLQNYVPSSSRTELARPKTPLSPVKQKTSPFKAASVGAEMSTTMVQLLDKLEEIEKEEDEIRNRWLHIQYSDPYQHKDPGPVVLPSAELLASPSDLLEDSPTIYTEHCKDSGLADITLPTASVKSIETYQRATQRHLTLTRHNKTADFDPWATINSMVDNIVDKLVVDVCGELLQTCDGLAENLYMSEFLPVEEQPTGLI